MAVTAGMAPAHARKGEQSEAAGEYGIAEDIHEILRQEQEHQMDLADALGIEVPRA